jgi:hypothetical protein
MYFMSIKKVLIVHHVSWLANSRPALEYLGSEEERSAVYPSGSLLDEALGHP